jgi:site-specific DNA recombinase
MKAGLKREIAQLDSLLNRIVESENPSVIAAYEKNIARLERDKLILVDKLDQKAKPKHTPEEIFELSVKFLSSHWNIWENGGIALKKTILRLVFKEHLAYDRESGFRTHQRHIN